MKMIYECCECFELFIDYDYNEENDLCCPHCQSIDIRQFDKEERMIENALDRKFDEERGK